MCVSACLLKLHRAPFPSSQALMMMMVHLFCLLDRGKDTTLNIPIGVIHTRKPVCVCEQASSMLSGDYDENDHYGGSGSAAMDSVPFLRTPFSNIRLPEF